MAKFIILGQQPLSGEIKVLGAKNAAIKMIAAACLLEGETVLENVPDILDIQKIITILEKMGVKFTRENHHLSINTRDLQPINPDSSLVAQIRASVILVGPLLARFGKITIPHPGGCLIGSRPIDLHLWALKQLGVTVTEKNGLYQFYQTAPLSKEVTISFPKISVGATENVILYACLQEQPVTIENAAIEPEIMDLIEFLKKAGVQIEVTNRKIAIFGKSHLRGVTHRVVPDRIEAGTFIILAATTKNSLKITEICPQHLTALLGKIKEMGVGFDLGEDFIYIKKPRCFDRDKPNKILAAEISTAEYPGFPTDLQPSMGVLLSQATGRSLIKENLFENRLGYLEELQKMGAKINQLGPKEAEIIGPTPLSGAKIHSLDLRAGATQLIAALAASGTTEILQAENIDRGYEKIEERLSTIGAQIRRVK